MKIRWSEATLCQKLTALFRQNKHIIANQEHIMATNEEILAAAAAIKLSEEAEVAVIQQIADKQVAADAKLAELVAAVEALTAGQMDPATRDQVLELANAAAAQSAQNTAALQALVTPPVEEPPVEPTA